MIHVHRTHQTKIFNKSNKKVNQEKYHINKLLTRVKNKMNKKTIVVEEQV